MIKKAWGVIKAVNPLIIAAATIMALFNQDYQRAIVCMLFLVLLVLGDIRAVLEVKE